MSTLYAPVLLTGMKHCGKSSTARLLSNYYSVIFSDIDDVAETIYLKENGEKLTSREIYQKGGKALFQSYELKASEQLSAGAETTTSVVAAGGGICDNDRAIEALGNRFVFIFIDEEADLLYERIITNGLPAFLSNDRPLDDFIELYNARSAKYDKLCDMHIRAGGRTASEITEEITARLREENHAGE